MVRRSLFNVAAIVSLLLLVATGILWLRSYRITDDIFLTYRIDGAERISTMDGRILVQHVRPDLGVRGRFDHVSHRSDRVESLPPQPWPTRGGRQMWFGVLFVNRPPVDPTVIARSREILRQQNLPMTQPTTNTAPVQRRAQLMARINRTTVAQMFLAKSLPSYWTLVVPIWPLTIFLRRRRLLLSVRPLQTLYHRWR